MSRTEEYIERAATLRDAGFTTKAAQKDALDFLNRAYDRVRNEVADEYREYMRSETDDGEDESLWSDLMQDYPDLPYSLAHYRPAKHELYLDANLERIALVNRMVELRDAIKAAPVVKKQSKAQREQAILKRSPIPAIAAEFEPLKVGVKEDYISQFRTTFTNLVNTYGWEKLNRNNVYHYDQNAWSFVSRHLTYDNYASKDQPREVNEERLDKLATQYANDQVDAFVHKLALKLVDLENVELHNVQPHSFQFSLTGTLNVQKVEVHQNIKYGVSKLGNPYVQWPALIYVDGQRMSELEFQKMTEES